MSIHIKYRIENETYIAFTNHKTGLWRLLAIGDNRIQVIYKAIERLLSQSNKRLQKK